MPTVDFRRSNQRPFDLDDDEPLNVPGGDVRRLPRRPFDFTDDEPLNVPGGDVRRLPRRPFDFTDDEPLNVPGGDVRRLPRRPFDFTDDGPVNGPGGTQPSGGGLQYGGNDPLAWLRSQFGSLAPTSQSLEQLYNALVAGGVNVQRPTRAGGAFSDDKLTINGQMYDFIRDVGGANAAWAEQLVGAGGGGPGAGAGYTDPSSELYLNELLSRMEQLRKPVEDPLAPLYQLLALSRVQNLQGAPFTAGEDAALTARYMSPLTQARDASLQRNLERIGARGMLPTSGLLDELNKDTEATFEQNVAAGSNDLAVRAVQERQRRQDEQLSVLSDMLRFSKGQRGEDDQRSQELIELASMFPEFDERRLNMLLDASGDNSAAQANSAALGQQSQQLQRDLLNARTNEARDEAWGSFFGSLIDNWDKIF